MNTTSKSTGILAAGTTLVQDGQAILTGVTIHAAAADVVVTIYDALTATSTALFKYTLDISLAGLATYIELPDVKAKVGLTVVVSGTGGEAVVHYK